MKNALLNKVVLTLMVAAVALGLSSCKYDDGPGISLRSKKARVDGDWKVTAWTRDGQDVTADYSAYKIHFNKDGDVNMSYTDSQTGFSVTEGGKWTFEDHKKEMQLTFNNETSKYTIKELKNKEMKLDGTNDGVHETVTLEAQ